MIEYFFTNTWLFWLIIALVCLVVEIGAGDFFVTCFAIGALFSLISSFFGVDFWIQVVIFAFCSILSILFIRPSLLKALHQSSDDRKSNADALIGRIGTVIEEIEPEGSGYVKVDGDNWKAVSNEDEVLKEGTKVRIVSMESIVVTVVPESV